MIGRLLDWVEDTRMTHKVIVLLLSAGLTSIILFQFLIDPQRQRVLAFQQTIQSLDHRLATMKEDRQLETLEEKIADLTRGLEARRTALKAPIALTDVLTKAESVGVVLTSWMAGEPVPLAEGDVYRITLRLDAEGQYHALAHFLEELHGLPNALTLKSLDFQARERHEESVAPLIQASFELTGFQTTGTQRLAASLTS